MRQCSKIPRMMVVSSGADYVAHGRPQVHSKWGACGSYRGGVVSASKPAHTADGDVAVGGSTNRTPPEFKNAAGLVVGRGSYALGFAQTAVRTFVQLCGRRNSRGTAGTAPSDLRYVSGRSSRSRSSAKVIDLMVGMRGFPASRRCRWNFG